MSVRSLVNNCFAKYIQTDAEGSGSVERRLSPRELEVLQLFGRGLGMREIAAKPEMSPKTIENHQRHIRRKFGFKTGAEVEAFCYRLGRL